MYNTYNNKLNIINGAAHQKLLNCFGGNKSIEEFQTRINVMQSTVNKMGDKLEEDSKET